MEPLIRGVRPWQCSAARTASNAGSWAAVLRFSGPWQHTWRAGLSQHNGFDVHQTPRPNQFVTIRSAEAILHLPPPPRRDFFELSPVVRAAHRSGEGPSLAMGSPPISSDCVGVALAVECRLASTAAKGRPEHCWSCGCWRGGAPKAPGQRRYLHSRACRSNNPAINFSFSCATPPLETGKRVAVGRGPEKYIKV
jgi:hypothetical protein